MNAKTARKLTTATALAALAGGFLGAAPAHAQLSSSGPADIEGWTQMGWSAFSGSILNKGGSHLLLTNLPEGAKPLPANKARAAIAKPLAVKDAPALSVSFNPDGRLNFYDGCNAGSATYSVDEKGTIQTGNLAETQRLCDPTTLNKADELKAILRSNPAVYRIDANTIALGAQGKAVEFVAPAAS